MEKLELYKPNQLIEIEGQPLTTQGVLAYNFLLHKFQQEKSDKIIINLSEIFEALEISDKYEDLSIYLDSLLNIKIRSFDKKGKLWGGFNLLSEFKKVDNGVFIAIPPTIYSALCGTEKEKELYYTTLKLLEQKSFKCVYTSVFYELFKKYEKINIPNFLLDDLKKITGTINKYSEYKDFKRYVLNKSLKEINKFDNKYEYSFEEKRLGKKVNEIKFIRTDKNIIDVAEPQISDKLLNSIEKARKNRFVDDSYSQKAMEKLLQKYDEKDIIKALGELYKYNSEIKSFSKILTAKIEDIKNSKMAKIKGNQGYTLGREEVETPLKIDIIEPKKSEDIEPLDKLLEKLPIKISKADYEDLYNAYLKQLGEQHNPYLRKAFDLANLNRFKIGE